MARQTVELPSISFQSKTAATAYFRRMLNRYHDGEELTQDDDAILFELLQRHPDAVEKIGAGVKLFYRDKSPNHPTSCFHIERIDGTTTYPSTLAHLVVPTSYRYTGLLFCASTMRRGCAVVIQSRMAGKNRSLATERNESGRVVPEKLRELSPFPLLAETSDCA